MNSFRDLPNPPKGLKPVKKMLLQELMYLVVIVKLSITLLEMLNPVETCVPDVWRKTLLYATTLYVSDKCTRSFLSADILLKRCGHKLYTAIG